MSKKGKFMGSRVKRYMKLHGTTLSNHHNAESEATWQISIMDAVISSNAQKKKLIIELYNAKMDLYCDSRKECERWIDALTKAKSSAKSGKSGLEREKERSGAKLPTGDSKDGKEKAVDSSPGAKQSSETFKRSFKVIQPAAKQKSTDSSSSGDSEFSDKDNDDEHQPKNGLKTYEETPNSMIFKQFNFK